jgi:hypothetical protein
MEISYDVRYYNKYGDFLLKRVTQKNYYERLGILSHNLIISRSQQRLH